MVYQLKLMHFQILRFTVPQNHDGSCLKFTLSFHSLIQRSKKRKIHNSNYRHF